MRTVLIHTLDMDRIATMGTDGATLAVSLSALRPGTAAVVLGVGHNSTVTPVERRLLELGFISGERVEVVAEARPGRDPFVVRVGSTQLALRRREAETIWVELAPSS
jgi:ferrous iron transport protein A